MNLIVRTCAVALPLFWLMAGHAMAFNTVTDDQARIDAAQRLTGSSGKSEVESSSDGTRKTFRFGDKTSVSVGMQRRSGFGGGFGNDSLAPNRGLLESTGPFRSDR
ncbi:hypothetical protein [Telmatospirillum sp.]|uniref:hypothetical protein n=1 Tax=Telmatospirillum sp. TaxID=2079197 RepID=UPI00283F0626|nr:hypothetical protein [Telmatospirillum sp.]MDR3439224.1 hypothetical protein [Telmatospirillum sp.]